MLHVAVHLTGPTVTHVMFSLQIPCFSQSHLPQSNSSSHVWHVAHLDAEVPFPIVERIQAPEAMIRGSSGKADAREGISLAKTCTTA